LKQYDRVTRTNDQEIFGAFLKHAFPTTTWRLLVILILWHCI
jgi:hypothetical protein